MNLPLQVSLAMFNADRLLCGERADQMQGCMLWSYITKKNLMANLAPVSVGISQRERYLLESAAEQSRTTLSEFMRHKAVEAAEMQLLYQNMITLPASEWADQPANDIPALRKLAKTRPTWRS